MGIHNLRLSEHDWTVVDESSQTLSLCCSAQDNQIALVTVKGVLHRELNLDGNVQWGHGFVILHLDVELDELVVEP